MTYDSELKKFVEGLFAPMPVEAGSARAALENLYEIMRSRRLLQKDKETTVAREVINAVANHIQARFDQLRPTLEEREKMVRYMTAFRNTGQKLDALDNSDSYNAPHYHHNAHNLFVMAARLMVGRLHGIYEPETPQKVISETIGLIAASIHDIAHDGRTNSLVPGKPEGTNFPGDLEMRSYRYFESALEGLSFPDQEMSRIKWTLLATDPGLPGEIVKYGYSLHYDRSVPVLPWDELKNRVKQAPHETQAYLTKFMSVIAKDAILVGEAMRVKEVDMVASFGMSIGLWKDSTHHLDLEYKACGAAPITDASGNPVPGGQLFVMMNFVGVKIEDATPHISFMLPTVDYLYRDPLNDTVSHVISLLENEENGAQKIKGIWAGFANARVLLKSNKVGNEESLSSVLGSELDIVEALRRGTQIRQTAQSPSV